MRATLTDAPSWSIGLGRTALLSDDGEPYVVARRRTFVHRREPSAPVLSAAGAIALAPARTSLGDALARERQHLAGFAFIAVVRVRLVDVFLHRRVDHLHVADDLGVEPAVGFRHLRWRARAPRYQSASYSGMRISCCISTLCRRPDRERRAPERVVGVPRDQHVLDPGSRGDTGRSCSCRTRRGSRRCRRGRPARRRSG